jgi:hypothetical protein
MCNNAMIYNTAETIYFKAAKKLQQMGAKIMSVVCMSWQYSNDSHPCLSGALMLVFDFAGKNS